MEDVRLGGLADPVPELLPIGSDIYLGSAQHTGLQAEIGRTPLLRFLTGQGPHETNRLPFLLGIDIHAEGFQGTNEVGIIVQVGDQFFRLRRAPIGGRTVIRPDPWMAAPGHHKESEDQDGQHASHVLSPPV